MSLPSDADTRLQSQVATDQLEAAFHAAEQASPARSAAREADEKLSQLLGRISPSLPSTSETAAAAKAAEPAARATPPPSPGRTITERATEAAAASSEARMRLLLGSPVMGFKVSRRWSMMNSSWWLPHNHSRSVAVLQTKTTGALPTSSGIELESTRSAIDVSKSRLPMSPEAATEPELELKSAKSRECCSRCCGGGGTAFADRCVVYVGPMPAWMERPGSKRAVLMPSPIGLHPPARLIAPTPAPAPVVAASTPIVPTAPASVPTAASPPAPWRSLPSEPEPAATAVAEPVGNAGEAAAVALAALLAAPPSLGLPELPWASAEDDGPPGEKQPVGQRLSPSSHVLLLSATQWKRN